MTGSPEIWEVLIADEFDPEFKVLPSAVQDQVLSGAQALAVVGPLLGRPHVDTLKGSKHAKMKELRFTVAGEPDGNGVWRVAFAFDTAQRAILFVAGNKQGKKKFYKELIRKADSRYDAHEERVAKAIKRTLYAKKHQRHHRGPTR